MLEKSQVHSFLKANPIMNLAAVHDGKPLMTVVAFSILPDWRMYFVTHSTSLKAQALRSLPEASFVVWRTKQLYVQGMATAKEITARQETDHILDQVTSSLAELADFWPPVLQLPQEDYCFFELTPTKVRAMDLSINTIKNPHQAFTQIPL